MATADYFARHSTLPVLNWLGGRVPKAYLRIERSRKQLATVAKMAEPAEDIFEPAEGIDDENVLSAGDAVREADIDAAKSAGDTDIFVRGSGTTGPDSMHYKMNAGPNHIEQNAGVCLSESDAREALESLSIDALRELACTLQVHDRSKMTEKEELIDEICKRL